MEIADIFDARFPSKRVIEVHRTAAGDEEAMLHALVGQRLEDIVSYAHVISTISSMERRRVSKDR